LKRIYKIDLGDVSAEEGTVVEKTIYRDLMPDLTSFKGSVVERWKASLLTEKEIFRSITTTMVLTTTQLSNCF
jgi:hypothetical protein